MEIPKHLKDLIEQRLDPAILWLKSQPHWLFWTLLVIAFLAFLLRKPLWDAIQSIIVETKRTLKGRYARGRGKLTILISSLANDPDGVVTSSLARALDENFANAIEVAILPEKYRLKVSSVGNISAEREKIHQQALDTLKKRQGDLLLWGEVSEKSLRLYSELPSIDNYRSKVYEHDHQSLILPKDLPTDVSIALSALIIKWASPVGDSIESGFPQAKTLSPLLKKLRDILKNLPSSLLDFKGDLYHSSGLLAARIAQETGDQVLLREAIAAFQEAFKFFPQENAPLDWTITCNNIGNALQTLYKHENNLEYLHQAIDAYNAVIKVFTREQVPEFWALTQNNLGSVYRTLGRRENNINYLRLSANAYKEALTIYPDESDSLDWAMIQNNLGNTLKTFGEILSSSEYIQHSISAYNNALKVRTQKRAPLDYAITQNNLANAFKLLGILENNPIYLQEARSIATNALKVFAQLHVPYYSEIAQKTLESIEVLT